MTRAPGTPRFEVGEEVRIQRREEPRHHRVPSYAQGCRGVVERACGTFGWPELLADGVSDGPLVTLYRVRIPASELWGTDCEDRRDCLEIEVYEHWLEAPGDPEGDRR